VRVLEFEASETETGGVIMPFELEKNKKKGRGEELRSIREIRRRTSDCLSILLAQRY